MDFRGRIPFCRRLPTLAELGPTILLFGASLTWAGDLPSASLSSAIGPHSVAPAAAAPEVQDNGALPESLFSTHELRMRAGDQRIVGDLHIYFVKVVADARCPESTPCDSAGAVVVQLEVSAGPRAARLLVGNLRGVPVRVGTSYDPAETDYSPGAAYFSNWDFALASVRPAKKTAVPIDPSKYRITLKIGQSGLFRISGRPVDRDEFEQFRESLKRADGGRSYVDDGASGVSYYEALDSQGRRYQVRLGDNPLASSSIVEIASANRPAPIEAPAPAPKDSPRTPYDLKLVYLKNGSKHFVGTVRIDATGRAQAASAPSVALLGWLQKMVDRLNAQDVFAVDPSTGSTPGPLRAVRRDDPQFNDALRAYLSRKEHLVVDSDEPAVAMAATPAPAAVEPAEP